MNMDQDSFFAGLYSPNTDDMFLLIAMIEGFTDDDFIETLNQYHLRKHSKPFRVPIFDVFCSECKRRNIPYIP